MKVRYADEYSIVVEISIRNFQTMTGVKLHDHYGNRFPEHKIKQAVEGKEFELDRLEEIDKQINYLIERRTGIVDTLGKMKEEVDKFIWPLEAIGEKKNG